MADTDIQSQGRKCKIFCGHTHISKNRLGVDLVLKMTEEFDQAVEVISILLQSALRQAAPKSKRTSTEKGDLPFWKSIKVIARPGGIIEIHADEIWKHIEFGTNPHVIRPVTKKALAFEIDGEKIIVKKVNHPGTRPNPFFRHTLNTKFPRIVKQVLGAN